MQLKNMKKLTPLQSIKYRCRDCKETNTEVKNCKFKDCELYLFRNGKRVLGKSRLKSIRKHCLWCCYEQNKEVKLCPSKIDCPLWIYRFGKNPTLSGKANRGSFKKSAVQGAVLT